jgi:uncharacterized protein (TIGR02266 family)
MPLPKIAPPPPPPKAKAASPPPVRTQAAAVKAKTPPPSKATPPPPPAAVKAKTPPPAKATPPPPATVKAKTPPPAKAAPPPLPAEAKAKATPTPAPAPAPGPGEVLRRDRRHNTSRLVEVHCKTWKQFIRVYIQDISRGGMFLASNDPPQVDASLEIRIVPPGGDALTLSARVVHVIPEDEAAAQQRKPGVGVAFENLDETQQRHVQALVQIARLNQESARKDTPPPPPAKRRPPPPPRPSSSKEAQEGAKATSDLRVEDLLGEEPRGKTGTYSIVSDFAIEKIREHIEHKRYHQAERQLQAIVDEQPYNARAQVLLYLVQARQLKVDGELEQANAKYQAVLELDEGNAEAVREVRAFHRSKRGSKGFLSRVLSRKDS